MTTTSDFFRFVGRNFSLILGVLFLSVGFTNIAIGMAMDIPGKRYFLEAFYQFQLSCAWGYIHYLERKIGSW